MIGGKNVLSRIAAALCAAVVSVALLGFSGPVQGQDLALGVEAGPTFADFSVEDGDADLDSKTGFRVAGVVRVGLGGIWGLQSGVGLAQKGATAAPAQTGAAQDIDFNVDYVEVPLLLTLGVPTGASPVSPRLFAGPQVGFESSCDVSTDGGGISGSVDCDADGLGEGTALSTSSTDFSVVFGGGIDVQVSGPLALTLDGRYDLGLSDINDSDDPDPAEISNRTFSVSGGLLLQLP